MPTLDQIKQQAQALDADIRAGKVTEDRLAPEGRLALDLYRGKVKPDQVSPQGQKALGLEMAPQSAQQAPGFLARLEGKIRGQDPASVAARGRQVANDLGAGKPPTIGGVTLPSPADVVGKVQRGLGEAAAVPFRLAGKLDVAAGNRTPEEAESRAKQYGNITRDVAESALVPYSKAKGLVGLGTRALQSGALSGAQTTAETGSLAEGAKSAALGAGTQIGVEGLFKAGRAFLSAAPKAVFEKRTGRDLAKWLAENVPAWKSLTGSASAKLHEMAHGKGQELLSDAYEQGLHTIKGALPGDSVAQIPADVAKKAGITVMRTPRIPRANAKVPAGSPLNPRAAVEPPAMVEVPTRDLIDALPKLKKVPEFRRAALDAVDDTIDRVGGHLSDEFNDLRKGYKIGAGFREFAEQGRFLEGKAYDTVKAQAALTKHYADTLGTRGMGKVRDIIEGPLQASGKAIERKSMAGPGSAAGALIGGTGLGQVIPGLGHFGGVLGGAYMGGKIGSYIPRYTNVPPMLPPGVRQLSPAALQAIQQQIQRMSRGESS